jgi:4-hydroxy-3-polyprenylbenzoate decarboxylase
LTEAQAKALHPRILRARLLENTLLAVQVDGEGREVVKALISHPRLAGVRLIAAVSQDVALDDQESLLWGIFTRFDPARDVMFTSAQLNDAWPVYRGCLGIDATFKRGYPEPVVMDPDIIKRVDARWHQYWTA